MTSSLVFEAAQLVSILPPASREKAVEVAVDVGSRYPSEAAFSRALLQAVDVPKLSGHVLTVARLARIVARARESGELDGVISVLRGDITALYNAGYKPGGPLPWPGVFANGSYGWVGEVRFQKVKRVTNVPDELKTLVVDVFHAFYLPDPRMKTDIPPGLRFVARLVSLIIKSRPRRAILNEDLALALTTEVIRKLFAWAWHNVDRVYEMVATCAGSSHSSDGSGEDESADERVKYVRRVLEEVVKAAIHNASQIAEAMAIARAFAGKFKGKLEFSERYEIAEYLREYPVDARRILEAILSHSDEPGAHGGSIEFAGYGRMGDFSEVTRLSLSEYYYPDPLRVKRLATQEANVRKYATGERRGRKKKYILLIDKSGSMRRDNRLAKAKAVALALVLRPDVDDVTVVFFDEAVYTPIRVSDDPVWAVRRISGVYAGGGTNIDYALRKGDEISRGKMDLVLITDGEDTVTYKPKSRLVVMALADNPGLERIADEYIRTDDILPSHVTRL